MANISLALNQKEKKKLLSQRFLLGKPMLIFCFFFFWIFRIKTLLEPWSIHLAVRAAAADTKRRRSGSTSERVASFLSLVS